MTESTLQSLTEVFQEVFDDFTLAVTRDTTADDVEGWDSLMHVTLILRVEESFGIRCRSAEIARLQSVGDLVDLIDKKRAS